MKWGGLGAGASIGVMACLLAAGTALAAAGLSPASKSEIDALLTGLRTSECQFNRNGTWYSPQEAQAHLSRKLEYLVSKSAVTSAEQFIERAATKSSMTGQPYAVRCGNAPSVPSREWLLRELQALRMLPAQAGKAN